jgi:hypothetical protein
MKHLNWRTVAVLAIGIAIGTTMMATPAVGHVGGTVGHLWKKHIRPLADKRYYTKTQADTKLAALQVRVAELEAKLAAVTYDDTTKTFLFNDVNVQIVNGAGSTTTPNGRGNLIIGYNTDTNGLVCDPIPGGQVCQNPEQADIRSGSHNLVIGDEHTYTQYGGIVGGFNNAITGTWASVIGGRWNAASGSSASVVGGSRNSASGEGASVSAGTQNVASGTRASVMGGYNNDATGGWSAVSGGSHNSADGTLEWVGGTLQLRTSSIMVPGAGSVEGNGAYFTRAISKVCNAGELLLSGGAYWSPVAGIDDDEKELPLIHSRVLDTEDGWSARGGNDTNADRTLVVQALCLGP